MLFLYTKYFLKNPYCITISYLINLTQNLGGHHPIHMSKLETVKQASKEVSYQFPISFRSFVYTFIEVTIHVFHLRYNSKCNFCKFISPGKVAGRKTKACFLITQFQSSYPIFWENPSDNRVKAESVLRTIFSSIGTLLLYLKYYLSM